MGLVHEDLHIGVRLERLQPDLDRVGDVVARLSAHVLAGSSVTAMLSITNNKPWLDGGRRLIWCPQPLASMVALFAQ